MGLILETKVDTPPKLPYENILQYMFKDTSKIDYSVITNANNDYEYNKLINDAIIKNDYYYISRKGFEQYGIENFREFLKNTFHSIRLKLLYPDEKINLEKQKTETEQSDSTISADQYISKLNYSDVGYPDVDAGGSMRKYAETLAKQDPTEVKDFVDRLHRVFKSVMNNIMFQEVSNAGESKSWAYWDLGKQLYMNENPSESSDKYTLGNPIKNQNLFWEMVYRMIGWEMTNGGKKPDGSKYSSWELKDKGKQLYDEKNQFK